MHDCSSGGFGIAISEMAISGNLGAVIDVNKVPVERYLNLSTILFSESHGRYLITIKKECC